MRDTTESHSTYRYSVLPKFRMRSSLVAKFYRCQGRLADHLEILKTFECQKLRRHTMHLSLDNLNASLVNPLSY